ncbi:hypothetical protein ACP70R_037200 [Stipagrostis hirtigluma subsp. patula]
MSSKEWLPAGMDPNTSYLLNIRLVGDPSKCRAEWYEIDKVVDADMINFKDFVDDIADKYPHGYGEIVTVMYFDAETKTFPQVRTDQELLEMFAKHTDSKVVYMTIAYTLPNAPVHIPEFSLPDNPTSESTKPTNDPASKPTSESTNPTNDPATKSTSEATEPTSDLATKKPSTQPDDDNYLVNPAPENEHVGVDEEGLYLNIVSESGADPKVVNGGSDNPEGSECESDSDSSDSDDDYEEEDGLVGKDPPLPNLVCNICVPPV